MPARSAFSRDIASHSTAVPQLHHLPLSLQTAYAELIDEQVRQEIEFEKDFNMKRQGLLAAHAAEQEKFWVALCDEPLPVQRQERRSAHLGLQYSAYADYPTPPELESQHEEELQLPLESAEIIDLVSDDDESVQFVGEVPINTNSSSVADLDPVSPNRSSLSPSLYPFFDASDHSSSSYSSSDDDDESVQYIGQLPNYAPINASDLSSNLPTPYMGPLSRVPTPSTPRQPTISPPLVSVSPGWSRLVPVQHPVSPPLSPVFPGCTLSDYNNGRIDKRKRAISVSSDGISDLDLDEGEVKSPGAKRQKFDRAGCGYQGNFAVGSRWCERGYTLGA